MTRRRPERTNFGNAIAGRNVTAVNIMLATHPPMNRLAGVTMPASRQNATNRQLTTTLNRQIDTLNQSIDAYNKIYNIEEKLKALTKIERFAQEIREAYPGDYLSQINGYHASINEQLYNQVKQQQTILKETLSPAVPTNPAFKSSVTLEQMVEQISPEKLRELMEILSSGKSLDEARLRNLYPNIANQSQAYKDERERFASFLKNNTITYLGGGNAQNFKITNKISSEEKVLKVEYRFDAPKAAARDLRENALKGKMTEIFAERQALFEHKRRGLTTCSLLVTPLVRGGDLQHYASALPKDANARTTHTLDIGMQMADIFLGIQQANYAFPDPKTSNWLVNERGKLQLADDKSFVPAPNGIYSSQGALQKGYDGIITTNFMYPNEFRKSSFNVDSMHVYMLGKNLYQVMTNCDTARLKVLGANNYNHFNNPVFKTAEGKLIKEIIQQSIQTKPANRISLADAKNRLEQISFDRRAAPLKNESVRLLNILKKVDANSVQKYEKLIQDIKNTKDISLIERELKEIKNTAAQMQEQLIQEANTLLNTGLLLATTNENDLEKNNQLQKDLLKINDTTKVQPGMPDADALNSLQQKKEGLVALAQIVNKEKNKPATQEDLLKVNTILVVSAGKIMQATKPEQIKAMIQSAEKDINKIVNPGILQRIAKAIVNFLSPPKVVPVSAVAIQDTPVKIEPINRNKPPPKPPKSHTAAQRNANTQNAMNKVAASYEKENKAHSEAKRSSKNEIERKHEPPRLN